MEHHTIVPHVGRIEKTQYDRNTALIVARRMAVDLAPLTFGTYVCRVCDAWHVGRQPQNLIGRDHRDTIAILELGPRAERAQWAENFSQANALAVIRSRCFKAEAHRAGHTSHFQSGPRDEFALWQRAMRKKGRGWYEWPTRRSAAA